MSSIVIMFYKDTLPQQTAYSCINADCRRVLIVVNRSILTIVKAGRIPVKEVPPGTTMQSIKCNGCNTTYHLYYH